MFSPFRACTTAWKARSNTCMYSNSLDSHLSIKIYPHLNLLLFFFKFKTVFALKPNDYKIKGYVTQALGLTIVFSTGRQGSDDGEWTEHSLEAWPAAPHPWTAGGPAEGDHLFIHIHLQSKIHSSASVKPCSCQLDWVDNWTSENWGLVLY